MLRSFTRLTAILLGTALVLSLPAQKADKAKAAAATKKVEDAPAEISAKEQKTEELFGDFSSEAQLEETIKSAKAAGVGSQALMESRYFYGLHTQNNDYLIKLLPELEKALAAFKPDDSPNFRNKTDLEAIIAYTNALKMQKDGDEEGFRKSVLDALWLSPDQSEIFLPAIKRHQWQERWAASTIDPAKLKLTVVGGNGKEVSLATQMEGKKGILLSLWASWHNPCMVDMPNMKRRAAMLEKAGIAFAALNLDEQDAERIAKLKQTELGLQGIPWFVENAEKTLSLKFEVENIPHYILISPEGRILYNDNPQKSALTEALRKLAPDVGEWE